MIIIFNEIYTFLRNFYLSDYKIINILINFLINLIFIQKYKNFIIKYHFFSVSLDSTMTFG